MRQAIICLWVLGLSLLLCLGNGCQRCEQEQKKPAIDADTEVAFKMVFIPVADHKEPLHYEGTSEEREKLKESFAEAESLLAAQRDMNYNLVTTTMWGHEFPYRDDQDNIWTLSKTRPSNNTATYSLIRGKDTVYRFEAPFASSSNIIKGFIAMDSTWVLGYKGYRKQTQEDNGSRLTSKMVVNGIDIGEQEGYDDVYFFGWIEGEVFYVFKQDEQFSYVYRDKVNNLGWTKVMDTAGDGSYIYTFPEKRSQGMFFQVQEDGYWGFVVLYSELIPKDG